MSPSTADERATNGMHWDPTTVQAGVLALIEDEPDAIANLANVAAALYDAIPDLNWAGFYLLRGEELVLGPFQGRPACVRIAVGTGVCGTAVAQGATQRVADVHAFPGHIACDPRSRSELVVPLRDANDAVVAVLDLDSERRDRFAAEDQQALVGLMAEVTARIDWAQVTRTT